MSNSVNIFSKNLSIHTIQIRKYDNITQSDCLNECYIRSQISSGNSINNEDFLIMLSINKKRMRPDIPFCSLEENMKNNSISVAL
jgi:hypothetical protein